MLKDKILTECAALADAEYKTFNDRLSKSGYPSCGVRIPDLRKLAKRLFKESEWMEIADYRPDTFEGVILRGLMVGETVDFDRFTSEWDKQLTMFDSWAQTDTTVSSLKIMKKRGEGILAYYLPLKTSEGEFEKRFLVLLTMVYFLDDAHIDFVLNLWKEIPTGQYYTDMAIAWALATAAAKFYDKTLQALKSGAFSDFVHNKAIQKARESFRLTKEEKEELTRLKRSVS